MVSPLRNWRTSTKQFKALNLCKRLKGQISFLWMISSILITCFYVDWKLELHIISSSFVLSLPIISNHQFIGLIGNLSIQTQHHNKLNIWWMALKLHVWKEPKPSIDSAKPPWLSLIHHKVGHQMEEGDNKNL